MAMGWGLGGMEPGREPPMEPPMAPSGCPGLSRASISSRSRSLSRSPMEDVADPRDPDPADPAEPDPADPPEAVEYLGLGGEDSDSDTDDFFLRRKRRREVMAWLEALEAWLEAPLEWADGKPLEESGCCLERHSITTRSLQCLCALMPQPRHLKPWRISPHSCNKRASRQSRIRHLSGPFLRHNDVT